MNLTKTEIEEKLEQLAMARTNPFCYHCYRVVPSGRCQTCGSDDLMRSLAGVGVEFGCEWVIEHILATELTTVNLYQAFEDSVRECYPETTLIGWMNLDTVTVMKEMDPVSWRCAQSEWESSEESEGNIISFDAGHTFYYTHDIETFRRLVYLRSFRSHRRDREVLPSDHYYNAFKKSPSEIPESFRILANRIRDTGLWAGRVIY